MSRTSPRWSRIGRGLLAWAILLALPVSAPLRMTSAAASETDEAGHAGSTEAFSAAPVSGTLTLPLDRAGHRLPTVVLVYDALGPDPRGDRYVAQLLGAGIAVLEVLSPEEPSAALPLAAAALAGDPRIDGARIGVLGFGAGGAAALAAPGPSAARVLLYPGCAALPRGGPRTAAVDRTALLLVHGGADPANPPGACASAAEALARDGAAVRRIEYARAGFAWDFPSYGLGGRSLLPAPGGMERVPAAPWPELAALSAAQVAGFFALALKAAAP